MTRDELLQLIADVQQHKSETDSIEIKTAQGGVPKRLYEPLSAFANRPGGGVVLFGLDEAQQFRVVGVRDAHQIQTEVANVAAEQMEPALRPDVTVEIVDGKTVVAVEVPEISAEQKPCFYKKAGLQSGSYIRVGNTNRQMTTYEIFGYVSARTQPMFDDEVVGDATIDDLDHAKLEAYVAQLRKAHPSTLSEPAGRGSAQATAHREACRRRPPSDTGRFTRLRTVSAGRAPATGYYFCSVLWDNRNGEDAARRTVHG